MQSEPVLQDLIRRQKKELLQTQEAWAAHLEGWSPDRLMGIGDVVRMCMDDASEWCGVVNTHQMLAIYSSYYCIAVDLMRPRYIQSTGKSQCVPIIAGTRTLFAIQCRHKPSSKHDGCHGYVDATAIERLYPLDDGTRIVLKSGLALTSVWSVRAVRRQYNRALAFRRYLADKGIILR